MSARTSREEQFGSKRSAFFGLGGILNYYQKVCTRSREVYMLRWDSSAKTQHTALSHNGIDKEHFYGIKNSNCYGCLKWDRAGHRPSITQQRLSRRCHGKKHHQGWSTRVFRTLRSGGRKRGKPGSGPEP